MRRERIYRVPHRRRREGRTDYRQRLGLLRSGKPRFVVRKSLNNIVCQIVEYQPQGDSTLVTVFSGDIKKLGWNGHCGNLPAAYLTGLLCGARARKQKITEAVMDTGLHASTKGSGIYAALKGVLDAGLKISHSEENLPSQDRIEGKHIEAITKKGTKSKKTKTVDISKNFLQVKDKILKSRK